VLFKNSFSECCNGLSDCTSCFVVKSESFSLVSIAKCNFCSIFHVERPGGVCYVLDSSRHCSHESNAAGEYEHFNRRSLDFGRQHVRFGVHHWIWSHGKSGRRKLWVGTDVSFRRLLELPFLTAAFLRLTRVLRAISAL
jgi:hypothetical protein